MWRLTKQGKHLKINTLQINFKVMAKIHNYIEKRAANTMKLLPAAKEWFEVIFLTAFIKIGTALFAVLAGFHWISSKFDTLGTVTSVVFGVLFIGIIESLNAVFLAKATKMVLHKKYIVSSFLYFISLIVFSLSFIISTEGLASWKQNEPRATVKSNETKIENSYNQRITDLKTDIATVKKNDWKGKISIEQERRIANYSKQIEKLETEKIETIDKEQLRISNEKQKIDSVVNVKANEFHQIAGVVMFFQFFGNCLLAFLMFVVRFEKVIEAQTVQTQMTEFLDQHGEMFTSQLVYEYKSRAQNFFHSLNLASINNGFQFKLPTQTVDPGNEIEQSEIETTNESETSELNETETSEQNETTDKKTDKEIYKATVIKEVQTIGFKQAQKSPNDTTKEKTETQTTNVNENKTLVETAQNGLKTSRFVYTIKAPKVNSETVQKNVITASVIDSVFCANNTHNENSPKDQQTKGKASDITASVTDDVICSENSTKNGIKNDSKNGVITASVMNEILNGNKICEHCGKAYIYSIHNQKFCTENCKIESWNKAHPDTEFIKGKLKAKRKPSKTKSKTVKPQTAKNN